VFFEEPVERVTVSSDEVSVGAIRTLGAVVNFAYFVRMSPGDFDKRLRQLWHDRIIPLKP